FGTQGSPEGFARFEGNKDGITLTLQIKHLREGTSPYTVIIIYNRNNNYGVFRVGPLDVSQRNGSFKKTLDNETIKSVGLQPESIQYVLVAAEHRDRVLIPLVGI